MSTAQNVAAPTLPVPLNALSAEDQRKLEAVTTVVSYREGQPIFRAGSEGDACYLIDSGEVRLEVERPEVDSEGVLQILGAGEILGELALLDRLPRSASAYADTDVVARRLTVGALEVLAKDNPALALSVYRALGRGAATKLRATTSKLAEHMFAGESDPDVDSTIRLASAAQAKIADWDEAAIDTMLTRLATAIHDKAGWLAELTVAETSYGNTADKTVKNQVASKLVLESLVGRPARGVVANDDLRRVAEVAHPVGVIFGLIPVTNPVATAVFKTLIALKSRNAVIFSFHRGAAKTCAIACELMQQELVRSGAPADLIQWVKKRSSRRTTAAYMAHPGVGLILATGGAAMVRAAHSSGNPAIGVGPGNAPALVLADADLENAAVSIVGSKGFDNGVICASENNLVVEVSVRDAFVTALEAAGAAVLERDEADMLNEAILHDGHLVTHAIGKSAAQMAAAAHISRPYPIKLLVVPTAPPLEGNAHAGEMLAPICSLFTVADFEEGLALSKALLEHQGIGHTAMIHTKDEALIDRYGHEIPASRIFVNTGGVPGILGLTTGLTPSFTLGCGTFGGNSTTDNVTFHHLTNTKHLCRPRPR